MTSPAVLESAAAEVEAHIAAAGWDQRPAVFALVRVAQLRADDPALATRLGLDGAPEDSLAPVEQDELPDEALDVALAQLAWPADVAGCVLSQEIVILPPDAQDELPEDEAEASAVAATHPQRREARLVVAVLRDGPSAAILRLRGNGADEDDDLVTGPDLAPNLVEALLATLAD